MNLAYYAFFNGTREPCMYLNSNFSKQTKVLAALSHGDVCIKTLSAQIVKPDSEKRPGSALQSLN